MPRWIPEKVWDQQDCIIIGGGASLTNFKWQLLEPENTIGCNTAFKLGEKVCKVCIFGDLQWWKRYERALANYKGVVFTNAPALINLKVPWLWTLGRHARGLHHDVLGWNGNTGATAINLAILFGAKRIFLIGFDMKYVQNRSNWHNEIINPKTVRPTVYPKFCEEFRYVHDDWKKKFPDVEIWNVTNDSGLPPECIPWLNPDEFWASRGLLHMGYQVARA